MLRRSLSLVAAGTMLVGSTAFAANYSAEVLADNPIAYYRLGEASGTNANDASPNNNDGTYVGTITQGVTGTLDPADTDTAVDFDATGRVDSVALFNPAATSFTVEFWINNTGIGEAKGVVSQTDGSGLGRSIVYIDISGAGYFMSSFLGGVDTFSGFGVLNHGTWYHVALVVTDQGATSDLQWYLNGAAAGSGTGIAVEAADGIFKLASDKLNTGVLNGTLDEVAFYTTALSGSRIAEHYNSRLTPPLEVVPEPASLGLMLAGVALLGRTRRVA